MHICGNPWHGAAWAAAPLGLVLGGCTDMTREPPTGGGGDGRGGRGGGACAAARAATRSHPDGRR